MSQISRGEAEPTLPEAQSLMLCSGAAYWTGGVGGPGYIYSLGSGSGALKKFTLAGSTLTLNGVAAAVGNFTKWGGARLPETFVFTSLLGRAGCYRYPP